MSGFGGGQHSETEKEAILLVGDLFDGRRTTEEDSQWRADRNPMPRPKRAVLLPDPTCFTVPG